MVGTEVDRFVDATAETEEELAWNRTRDLRIYLSLRELSAWTSSFQTWGSNADSKSGTP